MDKPTLLLRFSCGRNPIKSATSIAYKATSVTMLPVSLIASSALDGGCRRQWIGWKPTIIKSRFFSILICGIPMNRSTALGTTTRYMPIPITMGTRCCTREYGRPTYMTEAEAAHLRALYAGNVTLTDRWVGAFLDLAERLGLFKNTLIIWGFRPWASVWRP